MQSLLIGVGRFALLPTMPVNIVLTVMGMALSVGILYEEGDDQAMLARFPVVHEEAKLFKQSIDEKIFGIKLESEELSTKPELIAEPVIVDKKVEPVSDKPVITNPVPATEDIEGTFDLPQFSREMQDLIESYSDGAAKRKVDYDAALEKANKISDGITAQINSQFPQAKSVTDVTAPIIAVELARQFADGTFYDHTFDTLKNQVQDPIKTEINVQFSDPNSKQVANGIADQIATQMAEQLIANPDLDSIQLTLVAKRNRLVYDEDVLKVIKGLKVLQIDTVNKYIPYMFNGSLAGNWSGTMKAPAYSNCKGINTTWTSTWFVADKESGSSSSAKGSYYGVSGGFGNVEGPFGFRGISSGAYYTRTTNNTNFIFRIFGNSGPNGPVFKARVLSAPADSAGYDNSISGTFSAICPSNPSVGTAGTFTGRRLKNDIIGPWKGVSSIKEPEACKAENAWTAQLSESDGDIFGMFTQGEEKYEARGIYDAKAKEVIWIAGDYAFLGLIAGSNMTGTMLGPDCASGTNSAGGKDRQGTFEANLGDPNVRINL